MAPLSASQFDNAAIRAIQPHSLKPSLVPHEKQYYVTLSSDSPCRAHLLDSIKQSLPPVREGLHTEYNVLSLATAYLLHLHELAAKKLYKRDTLRHHFRRLRNRPGPYANSSLLPDPTLKVILRYYGTLEHPQTSI